MKTTVILTVLGAVSSVIATPGWKLLVSDYDLFNIQKEGRGEGTIIDRLREDNRFSKFVEVLSRERGLRDDLENLDKKTTVFAPTNEAMERFEEQLRSFGGGNREEQIGELLRYHITPDIDIEYRQMHSGTLLPTDLRLKTLGDKNQKIRIMKFNDQAWLNMRSRVSQRSVEAANGRIYGIDNVLVPPLTVCDTMLAGVHQFSTFLTGVARTQMDDKLCMEKGVTVFAPSNRAWELLGFDNIRYLFSCAGQTMEEGRHGRGERGGEGSHMECQGTKDLRKIMKHHMGTDLAYSTDFMQKEKCVSTLQGGELCVKGHRFGQGRGGDRDRDDDDDRDCRRRGSHHCNDRDDRDRDHGRDLKDIRGWNFLVNNGESRIEFTDVLGNNGVIHLVDNVIIPEDVKLPFDRLGTGMM